MTTFAGLPGSAGSADGSGSAARFSSPIGIAVDNADNVYVADGQNHTIRKITSGGEVMTLAGSPGDFGSADGTGTAAKFRNQQMSRWIAKVTSMSRIGTTTRFAWSPLKATLRPLLGWRVAMGALMVPVAPHASTLLPGWR